MTIQHFDFLFKRTRRKGLHQATPTNTDPDVTIEPWMDFSFG